jgi:hypothetical protein
MATVIACVVASAFAAEPGERVREPGGAELVIADGRLFRERGGARLELGCTSAQGPGRVLDLALDPAGLVFVAAEHGLHVVGPFVDALDPVARLDEAPRGAPTSVFVDDERRLWLATGNSIGVLDVSFFWGRTLAKDDLPGPGPYRVARGPDGRVLLSAGERTSAYVERADDAPRVTQVLVDGVLTPAGARLERATGSEIVVTPTGAARGGATFRYRFDRHHVWRALEPGAALHPPNPGAHVLEVIALDQALRRSPPWELRLAVAYPLRFDQRFVVSGVVLGAALVLVAFLLTARGRAGPWRALVSTALVVVLGLQVLAGLEPHAKGWPFVGFGMYTRSFAQDEIVFQEQLVVLLEGGQELPVRAESSGVKIDEIWQVARPLIDGGAPAMAAFLADWRARFPHIETRGLQVQARRARLTRAGPVPIAPLVLAHHRGRPARSEGMLDGGCRARAARC